MSKQMYNLPEGFKIWCRRLIRLILTEKSGDDFSARSPDSRDKTAYARVYVGEGVGKSPLLNLLASCERYEQEW